MIVLIMIGVQPIESLTSSSIGDARGRAAFCREVVLDDVEPALGVGRVDLEDPVEAARAGSAPDRGPRAGSSRR